MDFIDFTDLKDFTNIELLALLLLTILLSITMLRLITGLFSGEDSKEGKDEKGRIKDDSVEVSNVSEVVKEFEYSVIDRLKDGYTERSIQKQLKTHLQNRFVSVIDEYGIEGQNGIKIDFDIGNGKVGLELKTAKSLLKTANLHRLMGQTEDYVENKYNDNNLIVALFGEKKHTNERAMLKKIKEKLKEKGVFYLYVEIPSKH